MTGHVQLLDSLSNYGIQPSLRGIRALCAQLGRPQKRFSAIQVTGTNGKTSTARMIAAILTAHGLKTGLYVSPHLERYHERFVIDGVEIGDDRLAELVEEVSAAARVTQFEFLTGMAFAYFAQEKVDVAVIEVGMGGRWDATSVVLPKVAVITNVTLDHADYLGPTTRRIAAEKAYVIKGGTQAVAGPLSADLRRVFERRAHRMRGTVSFLGDDIHAETSAGRLTVRGLYGAYRGLTLGLAGGFQVANAGLAVGAAEAYIGRPLDHRALSEALAGVTSPGRLEFLRQPREAGLEGAPSGRRLSAGPAVVLDGAHNVAGAGALRDALAGLKYRCLILVLSILRDKQVPEMLEILLPMADKAIFVTNANPRALPAGSLAEEAAKLGFAGQTVDSWRQAIESALKLAGPADLVLVTGSLYGVGEARPVLRQLLDRSRSSDIITDQKGTVSGKDTG